MLPWRSEGLGMTLKYGKAWDLFVCLFVHSFMQQTFGEDQLYASCRMGWWKGIYKKIL